MALLPRNSKNIGSLQAAVSAAGPVAIGRFVAPLAGQALSRGGPVMAELLAEWPAIAGASLAAHTSPAKMTKAAPDPGSSGRNPPSTLLLKVSPGRALEVQYLVPQLIERINKTLGFKAVSALRIVQAPICNSAKRHPAFRSHSAKKVEPFEEVSRLDAALARMSAGVKMRRSAT